MEKAKDINDDDVYIAFDLDPLTLIYFNKIRNMGGLLYMSSIKENGKIQSNISLKYNERLKIAYNYYIYFNSDQEGENTAYPIFSDFCPLKVVNCYKSCFSCNEDIEGTDEFHQCSECKSDYYKYLLNLNDDTIYFNCYKNDDSKILEHYFLDSKDNRFYECDKSCKTCKNNKTCDECNNLYYKKKDNLTDLCYDATPDGYYFDTNISMYMRCYKTCSSCFGGGDEEHNKCFECQTGFKKYSYDSTKCTDDYTKCKYWMYK